MLKTSAISTQTTLTFLMQQMNIYLYQDYLQKAFLPKHTLSLYCKLHQHLEYQVCCLELHIDCVVCWHFARNWSNNTLTCKYENIVMNFYTTAVKFTSFIMHFSIFNYFILYTSFIFPVKHNDSPIKLTCTLLCITEFYWSYSVTTCFRSQSHHHVIH
jgi:hypothetical protein